MCFAPPARVIEVGPAAALVERGELRFRVALHLLDEPVAVGDWLAVQAQRQAVARLSAAEAEELLALYEQIHRALEGSN